MTVTQNRTLTGGTQVSTHLTSLFCCPQTDNRLLDEEDTSLTLTSAFGGDANRTVATKSDANRTKRQR